MTRLSRMTLLTAACAMALTGAGVSMAHAETLADAISLAYQNNATLKAQRENQRALDETYAQAKAGIRPTVSLDGDVAYQSAYQPPGFLSRIPNATQTQSTSGSTSLTVTQPLYTGGRVSSQISAAEADIMSGQQTLRNVEANVLGSVVQAYVDVRRDQERLRISVDNVTVLKRQREEANARFAVGEITRTDVAQAEARLAAAQASLSSSQAQLEISRANYTAAVGQSPGELAPEPSLANILPATIEQAYEGADKYNPQVLSAVYAQQAAAARVAQAKAVMRPTLSLRAQAGYSGSNAYAGNPFNARATSNGVTGDYTDSYSASVNFTYPLFEGGLLSSQVRQAEHRYDTAVQVVRENRRDATQRIAQAWNQLEGSRANIISNREQVRATKVAFEGVQQEAQVGLRTTLDVLNAEQELRSAELSLVNAVHDEYVAAASVLAAMGLLEARNLSTDTPIYDPNVSFKKARHAIGWVPWEPVVQTADGFLAPKKPKK